jgi:hypothetical protein
MVAVQASTMLPGIAVIAAHQVRVTKTPPEYDTAAAQPAPQHDGQVQNTWISS